jgi:putative ABC transport system permease protein
MLQDLRLALRRILHSGSFSICVVLILSAGIGVAGAMGSVWSALAFRPLNLPTPETLVAVSSLDPQGFGRNTVLPALDRLRAADLAATGWCAYNSTLDATESGGRVLESGGELMAGDCAKVIGVEPVRGRWFTTEEAPLTGAGRPVMIISYDYWHRMFDGAADVLGRSVRIQNVSLTVIGVMPEGYTGISPDLDADFILPFNAHRASSGAFKFLGQLKPGATLDQLHAQVRALWPSVLEAVLPPSPTRAKTLSELSGGAESMTLGLSTLRRLYSTPVQRLAILALALLVLVCVNVGGLMVSRVAGRAPEIAAMRALGASPMRIARPLLAECTVFAIGGALLGLPLAYVAAGAFRRLFPTGNRPWSMATTPDPGVVVAIVAGSIVVAFLIAALPAWLATRIAPQFYSARTVSFAPSRWSKALLIAQVGVTVVLVFTSGLLIRSFNGLRSVDRGYEAEQLLSLRLSANPGGYQGLNAPEYYRMLVDRVTAVPGVQSVGLARYFGTMNVQMTGQPVGFAGTDATVSTGDTEYVSPGFFAAAGVPLLSGRDVAWTDLPSTPRVAIVSESLARALAPDGDVIGRVIRHGSTPATAQLRIVGVAGNLSMGNVRQNSVHMIYLSSIQMNETQFGTVHIRTSGPPMRLAAATSDAVASLGREHVRSAHAHDVLFGNSMVAERMGTAVSSAAAVLALVISGVGLFALLSHSVQKRTREIGIRVAVGATPGAVSKLVIRDALVLVLAGLAIGLPGAVAATSLVRSLLFGVTTTDGVTLTASAALLLATAMIGAVHPTLRAVRVEPTAALRD